MPVRRDFPQVLPIWGVPGESAKAGAAVVGTAATAVQAGGEAIWKSCGLGCGVGDVASIVGYCGGQSVWEQSHGAVVQSRTWRIEFTRS
jgi:hypothetical protein